MTLLIIGLALFLASHSLRIFAPAWREAQIARLGETPWKGITSLLSLAGFGLIVWGFGIARLDPVQLWVPPVWTRHLAALLTLPAFILLVAAYVPGNRIKARLGHPMVASVKIWALAHLLANGKLAADVVFLAFLVWAVLSFTAGRRRDRLAGVSYPVLGAGRDAAVLVIGLAAWAAFAFWGHAWLIGVKPFG